MESLQEYGQNREKMNKSKIEMENICETVGDFLDKNCEKSILFLTKNLAEGEIKKGQKSKKKIERQGIENE